MRSLNYSILGTMIISAFLIGCASNSGVSGSDNGKSSSTSIPINMPIVELNPIEKNHMPIVESNPIPMEENNFFNIKFMYNERDRNYYYNIVHSINPEFMEGLQVIEIYNPDKTMYYWKGIYISPDKIRINDYSGQFKYQLIHELIHHYCYHKENNSEHSYCFYHNPIQDDYRDEFRIICGDNQCEV